MLVHPPSSVVAAEATRYFSTRTGLARSEHRNAIVLATTKRTPVTLSLTRSDLFSSTTTSHP